MPEIIDRLSSLDRCDGTKVRTNPFSSALIVEGDPVVAKRMVRILDELAPGARVMLASTSAQAEILLATSSFDLVFVDMQLRPPGAGALLIACVHDARPRTEVVAMSATDSKHLVKSAFASGATGYLLSDATDEEIGYELRQLRNGGMALDPRAVRHLLCVLQPSA